LLGRLATGGSKSDKLLGPTIVFSFLFNAKRARQIARNRPVTFGLPLALLKCVRQVERQANQEERSNPMKVKTNTKAGSAMWGS